MRKPPPTHYILRAPSVCPLCHAEQKVGEDVTHFGACWPRCLVSVPSKSIKREHGAEGAMSPCPHLRIDRGQVYDVCLDCGAVRLAEWRTTPDNWHTCALCSYGASASQSPQPQPQVGTAPQPSHASGSGRARRKS